MSFKKLYLISILLIISVTLIAYFVIINKYSHKYGNKPQGIYAPMEFKDGDLELLNADIGKYGEFDSSLFLADTISENKAEVGLDISVSIVVDSDFVPNLSLSYKVRDSVCEYESESNYMIKSYDEPLSKSFCFNIANNSESYDKSSEEWTILDDMQFKEVYSDFSIIRFVKGNNSQFFKAGVISVCDFEDKCAFATKVSIDSSLNRDIEVKFGDKTIKAAMPSASH